MEWAQVCSALDHPKGVKDSNFFLLLPYPQVSLCHIHRSIHLFLNLNLDFFQRDEWNDQSEGSSKWDFCSKQAGSKLWPVSILCKTVPFWCCLWNLWGITALPLKTHNSNSHRWATIMSRRIIFAQIWTSSATRMTTPNSQGAWKLLTARLVFSYASSSSLHLRQSVGRSVRRSFKACELVL